jgi:hypothetical protein
LIALPRGNATTTSAALRSTLFVVGSGGVALSLVDAYMVGVEHVPPGEPLSPEELAYPLLLPGTRETDG